MLPRSRFVESRSLNQVPYHEGFQWGMVYLGLPGHNLQVPLSSRFHAELNHCIPNCFVDVVVPTSAPPNPHLATLHHARSKLHGVLVLQTGIHSRQSASEHHERSVKHHFCKVPTLLQRLSLKGGGSTLHWFHMLGSRLLWTRGEDLPCC